jgi:hypothetical protein
MKTMIILLLTSLLMSCKTKHIEMEKIIFLHHSTGQRIWIGNTNRYLYKLTQKGEVQSFFDAYNKMNKTNYLIHERSFPAESPYGWKNYPYDYYNIWVKHAGEQPFMNEPTLEILSKEYNIIIFKHCYPLSKIQEDTGMPDINSEARSIENYKLQYLALRDKMHEFQNNKFIVWTPAVHVKNNITQEEAERTRTFYNWIINEWDEKGDNIFIWDFYKLETEGGLYFPDKNATSVTDSHPNKIFASRVAPLFGQFIIDVANNRVE